MDVDKKEQLAIERMESLKQAIADSLNLLESKNAAMRWACESMEWDDEVCYQVEKASIELGYALATLHNWFKD